METDCDAWIPFDRHSTFVQLRRSEHTMAMQQVIQCTDILVHIFEHMTPPWLDQDAVDYYETKTERILVRQTLAAAARVSQAFSDPALDVLWSVLDDCDTLLRLLPVTVVTKRLEGGFDGVSEMVRLPLRVGSYVTD